MRGTVQERFWAKVQKGEGCWEWVAGKQANGYGKFVSNGSQCYAHRLSYEWHAGQIPDGMFVLHSCDNRACVNPAHLRIGTAQDNADDMVARERNNPRRSMTHCMRGHPWEESNITVLRRGTKTYPQCKICHRQQSLDSYHRKT